MISFWRKDRAQLFETNITGTQNIIDLCVKHGARKYLTSIYRFFGTWMGGMGLSWLVMLYFGRSNRRLLSATIAVMGRCWELPLLLNIAISGFPYMCPCRSGWDYSGLRLWPSMFGIPAEAMHEAWPAAFTKLPNG